MCLIVFAYRVHPDFPVIIAANRDEFYARPTQPLFAWTDGSDIVAGRDLKGGGTWMGITRHGRLAALTNYREPGRQVAEAPSRGHLVKDFLMGSENLNDYLQKMARTGHRYNGFNMILSEGDQWVYYSNRNKDPQVLPPGVHGLSNHLLNTPWPKVVRSRQAVATLLARKGPPDVESLMQILQDRTIPPDGDLPDTGIGMAWERRLGSIFIHSEIYGTRSSTVLLAAKDGRVRVRERTFKPDGSTGDVECKLRIPVRPA